jgi:acyl-CoA synthetase (AMP-forming)/AMP-acid ligase II
VPARVAVGYPEGRVSYAELLARVRALAARLPGRDESGLGEPVAVVAENDHMVPELYLGVMAAGHAVLPISSRLPDEAIARIVAKAGARVGFVATSAARRLRQIAATADATRWFAHGDSNDGASHPGRVKRGLPGPPWCASPAVPPANRRA